MNCVNKLIWYVPASLDQFEIYFLQISYQLIKMVCLT